VVDPSCSINEESKSGVGVTSPLGEWAVVPEGTAISVDSSMLFSFLFFFVFSTWEMEGFWEDLRGVKWGNDQNAQNSGAKDWTQFEGQETQSQAAATLPFPTNILS
jgi:hypothetical protein